MFAHRYAVLFVSNRVMTANVMYLRSFPFCHFIWAMRLTSSGPPLSSRKPGSIAYRYEKFISKWPKIYALHRVIADGSRWCLSDVKTYLFLKRGLMTEQRKLHDLNMAELEVLVQMPVELPKVAISAILLPLPFGFYVVGFAIILFPRLVLTRHFWTDVQRNKFFRDEVVRSMANSSRLIDIIGNPNTIEDVHLPDLDELSADILVALAPVYSMFPFPGIGRRLKQRCEAMRQLDKVLAEHLNLLTLRQLNFHLYIRRVVTSNDLSDKEMRAILADWIEFTGRLDNGAYLCAPVFFNKKRST